MMVGKKNVLLDLLPGAFISEAAAKNIARTRCFGASVAIAAAAVCATQAHAALSFTAMDLGTLGGTNTYLLAPVASAGGAGELNASGQVVGYANSAGTFMNIGYRTGANGASPANIGNLGVAPNGFNNPTYAIAINDSGNVTGESYSTASLAQAYRTAPNTAINPATDGLGGLVSGANSVGIGINATGQVTGYAFTVAPSTSPYNAFRTTATGGVSGSGLGVISLLAGGNSSGYGISSTGTVVGISSVNVAGANQSHAFRILATESLLTTADDLGTLPGGTSSNATAINTAGTAVGTSATTSTVGGPAGSHAFRITAAEAALTSIDDLGNLGNGTSTTAYGINTAGQTVGSSYTAAGTGAGTDAFFVDTTGAMQDLNSLVPGFAASGFGSSGYRLSKAYSINDSDQIAAIGVNATGTTHTFLLSVVPVPEPTSLTGVGAVGMALLARRRKRTTGQIHS